MSQGAAGGRWWDGAVGYEVYIRSFRDASGDGLGDLDGLAEKMGYLAWLGVDVVWITPCFPSPRHDGGYDVADYLRVAEDLGGEPALDRVLAAAHARGMRVLLDLVPNHTSSEHPWFAASRSSRDDPKRDWYIWRDGATPGPPEQGGTPPSSWPAHFGGTAWSYDAATGQWWFHLFLPEQPDLDWRNPEVRAAFEEIIETWLSRGVDGFRIDVAHALVKHPELPYPPTNMDAWESTPAAHAGAGPGPTIFDLVNDADIANQPGVHEVYRRWRAIADRYDALLVGEVYLLEPGELAPYVADDELHLAFWFAPMHLDWEPKELRRSLEEGARTAAGRIAWVTSSHDESRATSRFGGGEVGRRRALALATLQFCLPGVPFVYQGEELGLEDVEVPPDRADDPIATRAGAHDHSRDRCRTPMPWAPGPGLGFSAVTRDRAPEPWLPMGPRSEGDTVEVQRADTGSMLRRWRALIALRRAEPDLRDAPVEWLTDDGPVVAVRRGRLVAVANVADEPARWTLPAGTWQVAFDAAGEHEAARVAGEVALGPADAVVVRKMPEEGQAR